MGWLEGRTVVITGGTGGIGLETAIALAGQGARLVLIGRDQARAAHAIERIRWMHADAAVEVRHADLSRRDEVYQLAAALDTACNRIDVLVNNAGAIFNRRETTADGLERTFALNHMGYFLLTALLREKLLRSAPARIVNVASEAHRSATLDFSDLQNARRYGGWLAYRRSKLCNILFTREMARRLAGTGVTVNCLHPGFVRTGIGDNTSGLFRRGVRLLKRGFAIPVEQGARTLIYAASAPEIAETTGTYFIDCKPATPSAAARDDASALRLWNESLALSGDKLHTPDRTA
jgi:NAD(P)-dependent dehydrogenase (short-subunit alcohol dehydrogenase family)